MIRATIRKLKGERDAPGPIPKRVAKPDIMSPDMRAAFYALFLSILMASALVIAALFIRFS